MSSKTRKHIWPVSLMMSIGIIGALAAFLVLANNPGVTMAHDSGDINHDTACEAMTDAELKAHNAVALLEGEALCGSANGNGDATGMATPTGMATATGSCTPRCRRTSGSRGWTTAPV